MKKHLFSLNVWVAMAVMASFGSSVSHAAVVPAGTDYFGTRSAHYDFGGSIGVVDFVALPFGPGNTDTIVQRQDAATVDGGPVSILLTQLSLKSSSPVNVNGSFFDVVIQLDPNLLAEDTGTIAIRSDGTFTTFLPHVFFEADFIDNLGNLAQVVLGQVNFDPSLGTWSATAPPGAVAPASNEFFPNVILTSSPDVHDIVVATVPEPATLALFGTGLGLLGLRRRRKAG